jgi:hypothetical protein
LGRASSLCYGKVGRNSVDEIEQPLMHPKLCASTFLSCACALMKFTLGFRFTIISQGVRKKVKKAALKLLVNLTQENGHKDSFRSLGEPDLLLKNVVESFFR